MARTATVVIPARNAAATLDDQLAALCGQDHTGEWEVVLADNGSTDGTRAKVAQWKDVLPRLRLVDASGPHGYAHPRNVGAAVADGDSVLFCDADDVVAPTWLRAMVEGLEDAEFVTGPLDRVLLNSRKQYEWMDGDDLRPTRLPIAYGHLPFVAGGNMAADASVLRELGGFDVRLRGGEDIDLSWRALRAGYRLGFAPDGILHYRLRNDARAVLVRRARGGFNETRLYRRYRNEGMGRDDPRVMARVYARLAWGLPRAVRSDFSRWEWAYRAGGRLGRLAGSVCHGVVFP